MLAFAVVAGSRRRSSCGSLAKAGLKGSKEIMTGSRKGIASCSEVRQTRVVCVKKRALWLFSPVLARNRKVDRTTLEFGALVVVETLAHGCER